MPTLAAQRGLQKPKSKLRLRLGLTPPHPKVEIKPLRSKPSNSNLAAIAASQLKSKSVSDHQSPPTTVDNSLNSSVNGADLMSSVASSMTGATHTSRADSRDAFPYDNLHNHSNHSPPFDDVVSYCTTSPDSGADISYSNGDTDPYQRLSQYGRERSIDLQSYRGRHDFREVDYRNDEDRRDEDNDEEDPLDNSTISPSILITHPIDDHDKDHPEEDHLSHPHITQETATSDDIFSLSDRQLCDRFNFIEEIGFGNWGSVWSCKPKHVRSSIYNKLGKKQDIVVRLGRSAAAGGGSRAGGKVAVKLVHRAKTSTTAARVKALWGEMKIIKSLKHEPHPSIIQFEAFVITPTYALVIMPFLPELIPVQLPAERARPYFRQLASAIGYLHERGITHNDIKPANVLLSHNDVPVLVDFGFANQWEIGTRGCFLSCISWGTPEYLDPQRAMGMPHDERASDVWSLGITMYEILIGRTPFEADQEEAFDTPEELLVYFQRSKRGKWLGEWSMPNDLIHLLRMMIQPDPAYRISAMQAYHHPALQAPAPSVIITPHFVRAAATFEPEDEPLPVLPSERNVTVRTHQQQVHQHDKQPQQPTRQHRKPVEPVKSVNQVVPLKDEKENRRQEFNQDEKKARRKPEKSRKDQLRSTTPTPALGESIKQHTATSHTQQQQATDKRSSGVKGVKTRSEDGVDGKNKLVIRKSRDAMLEPRNSADGDQEDITPTKVLKPAQPLRIKELAVDKKAVPRISDSQSSALSRPPSTSNLKDSATQFQSVTAPSTTVHSALTGTNNRESGISTTSDISLPARSKEEAVQKAMRHLEGSKKLNHNHLHQKPNKERDVLSAIRRPAPPAPISVGGDGDESVKAVDGSRPCSLDSAKSRFENGRKWDERRSLGEMRVLGGVQEETETSPYKSQGVMAATPSPDGCLTVEERRRTVIETVIPSPTVHVEITIDVEKTASQGQETSVPNGQSGERVAFPRTLDGPSPLAQPRDKIIEADREKLTRFRTTSGGLLPESEDAGRLAPTEVAVMDDRLDKIAVWVKTVEKIVEEARQALAEGREPPLPPLSLPADVLSSLPNLPPIPQLEQMTSQETTRYFGVTPDKSSSLPAHLRTSSTQVEPATPPKWMTYQDAVDKVKQANQGFSGGAGLGTGVGGSGSGSGHEGLGKKVVFKEKKERPSVAHVLKLFGANDKEKAFSRANTPEPMHTVPLKDGNPKTLRAMPSTPALRSHNQPQSQSTRQVPTRKSESNLRFNTLPTIPSPVALDDFTQAHSQVMPPSSKGWYTLHADPYAGDHEESSTSGVLGGDSGQWSSRLAPPQRPLYEGGADKKSMSKSTSIASLRERAKAWIRDDGHHHHHQHVPQSRAGRNITDLSESVDRGSEGNRNSRLVSTFSVSTAGGGGPGPNAAGAGGGRPGTPAVMMGQNSIHQGSGKETGNNGLMGFFRGFRNRNIVGGGAGK